MAYVANFSSNETVDLSGFEWLFISVGAAHIIFVIIPVLIVGPMVLAPFVVNKKLRDSVSIVFMFTIALCICAPVVYGSLMDINLITDVDIFGPCSGTHNSKSFFVFFAHSHQLLLVCNALLTILQNISVRFGTKKVSTRQTLVVLFFLFLYSLAGSLLIFITGVNQTRIRGSLCSQMGSGILILGVLTIILFLVPSILAIGAFSFLTIRYIRKNTISKVKSVRRLTMIIVIWLVLSILIRSLAVVGTFLSLAISSPEISYIYSFIGFYALELNYPLFLFLSLFLHTRVRAYARRKFCKFCCRKRGQEESHEATVTTDVESHDMI